jgi:hypothetical protein
MTNDERIQRESSLIATIRKKLPEFVKACADETELMLVYQDAFAADYQEMITRSSVWRSRPLGRVFVLSGIGTQRIPKSPLPAFVIAILVAQIPVPAEKRQSGLQSGPF